MRAGERITVNEGLIAAYQAASSPHSIRALKSDVEAFDAWCRRNNRIALPATPETVADYLDARAGKGSRPASLSRYKASIAKIHQLLELKDPTPAPLVKLRLQTVRREKGAAQKQARPLRFKGPVRDVERDKARGSTSARCSRVVARICRGCVIGRCYRPLMTPGCAPPNWWRSPLSILRRRSIPKRGCCRFCVIRAIKTGRGDRLPQPAHRRGDRGVDRSGGDHDRAAVPAGAGAALQGAGSRARSADRQHLGPGDVGSAQDAVQAGGEGARRI
jgi:hypothetical protein